MQYRKKPVVIEARQWDGSDESYRSLVKDPAYKNMSCSVLFTEARVVSFDLVTLEGVHRVSPGDFIIKGVKGEFYPCKPDIFEATYDPA